jgi:glycerol-3-phosphate acyltransferase PlsY
MKEKFEGVYIMIIALAIITSYIIGSIPSGLIVGKVFYKTDIRQHGSGNLGGTNTFRVLGKKAGFIVTIADILKGTLATWIPIMLATNLHPLIAGVIAVIGHMFPIFAGFRGGKAVATSGGVILGYAPIVFVISLLLFLLSLKLSKMVSFSSMIAGVLAFIYTLFTGDTPLMIIVGLLSLFIIYRHRTNIQRIRSKTEPKITWM